MGEGEQGGRKQWRQGGRNETVTETDRDKKRKKVRLSHRHRLREGWSGVGGEEE